MKYQAHVSRRLAKPEVIKRDVQPRESLTVKVSPEPALQPGRTKVAGPGDQVNENIAAAAARWSFLTI